MSADQNVAVSVIVPVYNCEKFIGKCIDSILSQTFPDFELLLVLDGCTDSSPQICKEYASRDRRIRVFEQVNQGVSVARNKGLENAIGKYVLFVDSDDWIEPDCLEKLVKKAEDTAGEIIICGFFGESNSTTRRTGFFQFSEHVFSETEKPVLLRNCLFFDETANHDAISFAGSPWAKLYKRDLLERNRLWFTVGLPYGEDLVFNLYAFWFSALTVLVPECLYHYQIRDDSCSKIYRPDMLALSERLCDEAWKFGEMADFPEWRLVCKDRWIISLIEIVKLQLIPAQNPLGRREKIKKIKEIAQAENAPYKCLTLTRKSFLLGNPRIFFYLLCLRQYWLLYLCCELKFHVLEK